jgi:hypothetical protein
VNALSPLALFTSFHTAMSIIALLIGLPVMAALLRGHDARRLVSWFLVTAVVTTLTGFLFPFHGFTPAIGVGIVSTVVLAVCLLARYGMHRKGGWRHADTVTLVLTEYFLIFVGIAQSFLKVAPLHALAPTGQETPFKVAQGVLLTLTVIVAIVAVRRTPKVMTSAPLSPRR